MATIISRGSLTHDRLVAAGMWTAQVVLATVFAGAGIIKLSVPLDRLVESMAWVESVPAALVRLVGAGEVLAAIALILPTASRPLTRAAAAAASLLTVLMLAAAMVHLLRGELRMLPVNLTLAALAAFVAWARLREHPAA